MILEQFLEFTKTGQEIIADSEYHKFMGSMSSEAQKITCEINNGYHTPEEICRLFEKLTGNNVDDSFRMFPPFTADFGRNIKVGKNVFINSGCRFQDHGGITISDGAQIGHNVVIATLNHSLNPDRRRNMLPQPVHIGKNVWIGSNSTILPGVTIGDNSIIGAGSVVTKDVLEMTVFAGNPAKKIKDICD